MMGWEGVFGLLITMLIIIPAQIFACPFSDEQCINGHIDDMFLAHQQLTASKSIIVLSLGFAASAAAFNGFGAFATKLTSVADRAVVEQSRVILIWTFFLLY